MTSPEEEWYREINYFPETTGSRPWIERKYLPSLSGKVLYVGVGSYTGFYHKLVKNPELFETVDVFPDVAKYGSPYGHYTCDLRDFNALAYGPYDHVSVYGVLGCGANAIPPSPCSDPKSIINALIIANRCLKPGGTLCVVAGKEYTYEFWDAIFNQFNQYKRIPVEDIGTYCWWGKRKAGMKAVDINIKYPANKYCRPAAEMPIVAPISQIEKPVIEKPLQAKEDVIRIEIKLDINIKFVE